MAGNFDPFFDPINNRIEANREAQQQYIDGKVKGAIGEWYKESNVPGCVKVIRSIVLMMFAAAIISRAFGELMHINPNLGGGELLCWGLLALPTAMGALIMIRDLWNK